MQGLAFCLFSLLVASDTMATSIQLDSSDAISFAADPSIPANKLAAAAKSSTGDILATFRAKAEDPKPNVPIFGDWLNLSRVSAFHFIADMDVDCDGVDFRCPHNPDGQPQTSFGHLDARRVSWYVIPEEFRQRYPELLKPNAVGAIVCNGKMFYGIFGDENGDSPEVIGEASLLTAQTCFPNDGLDGGTGHGALDVTYIIFGKEVPSGVGDKIIDNHALKTLGDNLARQLVVDLGI